MSKKSKIVAIGSMLFVFSILFIEVVVPLFEIEYQTKVIDIIYLLLMSFSVMVISFGSSFFFMEFFVREKTVLSGRPMTGLFSLCTTISIIIAPHINVFCTQSAYTIANTILCLLFVVGIIIIPITVVLISKVLCFFMIKKDYNRSSIIFYLIIGTFISSINYSFLFFSAGNGNNEGGPFHVFFGIILTIIALIANAKTIIKLKIKGVK